MDENERESERHAHAQEELVPVECGVRDSLSRSEVREVVAAEHQRVSGRRARSGFEPLVSSLALRSVCLALSLLIDR